MKKFIIMLLALMMILTLAACGSEPENVSQTGGVDEPQDVKEESTKEDEQEAADPDPYVFTSNGVDMQIMDDADAVMEALGEPISTFEADSCAFQGKDLFYYYDGFQLTVNDVDGVNKITAITIVDDTVKTPEGIGIGSAEEKIAEAFGEGFEKTATMYIYTHNTTCLQISVEGGKVTAVVYAYSVEG